MLAALEMGARAFISGQISRLHLFVGGAGQLSIYTHTRKRRQTQQAAKFAIKRRSRASGAPQMSALQETGNSLYLAARAGNFVSAAARPSVCLFGSAEAFAGH